MLLSHGEPWVTDFGLSTSANLTSMSVSSIGGRGTLVFRAPELFMDPPISSQARRPLTLTLSLIRALARPSLRQTSSC